MKTLPRLLLLFLIPLLFLSCHNDDDAKEIIPGPPTGTEVRYRFSISSTDVLTGFKYKKSDGSMEVGYFTIDFPLVFTKTIIVQKPFVTRMDLNFQNKSGIQQDYTVQIYIDGVLSDTQAGIVPVPPLVPVNPEVPFPPFSVSKTYTLQ